MDLSAIPSLPTTTTTPASRVPSRGRWFDSVVPPSPSSTRPINRIDAPVLGVLPGEGIGPEIIAATLKVLDAVEGAGLARFDRRLGEHVPIGKQARPDGCITDESFEFCRGVFANGGAILCGPGGGRFVYDLRQRFDLFCKLVPLWDVPALHRVSRLKESATRGIDMVVVRDNAGGVYQGRWSERHDPAAGTVAEHQFSYSAAQVARIVAVGARIALGRRRQIDVVVKDGGVPTVSELWRKVGLRTAAEIGVDCRFHNVDYAAYAMVQNPQQFDVLVAPNLLGDILADMGAIFMGSRGLTFSGNFSADGHAVYQTGHGAAHDLAGSGRANPIGQIYSLAMMLRESYGLSHAAGLIERAAGDVLAGGHRTDDVAEPGCRRIGTAEMGERIAATVAALATSGTIRPGAKPLVVSA